MKTTHKLYFKNSSQIKQIPDASVDLVVTSPPYPMIAMWDDLFFSQDKKITSALESGRGEDAFELMHRRLDAVWGELRRVSANGGIVCINIGDAVRTVDGRFSLYSNHARIQTAMAALGFSSLPSILWRKQTNAPNKFMGSGMLPPGAYVTLEHEYILIFRNGDKKEFPSTKEKESRRQSAFFWEERNIWFSDVWMDLKGATQRLSSEKTRNRSGAFPFELPYRLINMFSVKNDTVLDPFMGMGTTLLAAMAARRNSVGFDVEKNFRDLIRQSIDGVVELSNTRIAQRFENHLAFLENRLEQNKTCKHFNEHYQFPVITNQEKFLIIDRLKSVKKIKKDTFEADYEQETPAAVSGDWEKYLTKKSASKKTKKTPTPESTPGPSQMSLF